MTAKYPGFGTHRAVLALRGAMRRHRFAIHLDVRAFFPSVDLDILRRLITARVDPALMAVLDLVFECAAGVLRSRGAALRPADR